MDAGAAEKLQHEGGLDVWKQNRNIPLLFMQGPDTGNDIEPGLEERASSVDRTCGGEGG